MTNPDGRPSKTDNNVTSSVRLVATTADTTNLEHLVSRGQGCYGVDGCVGIFRDTAIYRTASIEFSIRVFGIFRFLIQSNQLLIDPQYLRDLRIFGVPFLLKLFDRRPPLLYR